MHVSVDSFLVLFIPCSHREAASMLVALLDVPVRAIYSTSRWTVCLLIAFLR